MLVAAHAGDLRAAAAAGLHTAFVGRPDEFGGTRQADAPPPGEFDFMARDFLDLAGQLGC
jgi:2-haloacid dehalogenase